MARGRGGGQDQHSGVHPQRSIPSNVVPWSHVVGCLVIGHEAEGPAAGFFGHSCGRAPHAPLLSHSRDRNDRFALQYVSTLRSATKGRANYSMQLLKYDFVPPVSTSLDRLFFFSCWIVVKRESQRNQ